MCEIASLPGRLFNVGIGAEITFVPLSLSASPPLISFWSLICNGLPPFCVFFSTFASSFPESPSKSESEDESEDESEEEEEEAEDEELELLASESDESSFGLLAVFLIGDNGLKLYYHYTDYQEEWRVRMRG